MLRETTHRRRAQLVLWKVASTFWTRTGGHPSTRHLDSSAPPCVCTACSCLSERLASWVRRPLQSCFWQRVQAKKDLPKVNRTTTQSNPSCSFVISLQIRTWPGARLLYGRPVKRSRHHAFLTRRAIRSVCQENEDGAARVLLEESRTCLQVGQQNDLAQNLSMPLQQVCAMLAHNELMLCLLELLGSSCPYSDLFSSFNWAADAESCFTKKGTVRTSTQLLAVSWKLYIAF